MVRRKRSRDSALLRSPKKEPKQWWEIKDIIDEDVNDYLVKWEPDSDTGKEFPASWVPKKDVTQAAIDAWNQRNQQAEKRISEVGRLSNPSLHGDDEVQDSDVESSGPANPALKAIVQVHQDSQFPREAFLTQVWQPSQESEASRVTSSWNPGSQDSRAPIASQISVASLEPLSSAFSEEAVPLTSSPVATVFHSSSPALDSRQPDPSTSNHLHSSLLSSISTTQQFSVQEVIPASSQLDSAPPIYPVSDSSPLARVQISTEPSRIESTSPTQTPVPLVHTNGQKTAWSVMSTPTSSGRYTTAPSPPMQDRVRSIRNSALSSNPRRSNGENHMTVSSRASSVVSEAPPPTGLSDARLEVRTADIAAPYLTMDSPPGSSIDGFLTAPKHELTLPTAGDKMEYFVSLPLPSRVRDQYGQTIQYFRKDIYAFLGGATDTKMVQTMRYFIQRLNNVSTHVDLENEPSQSVHEVPVQDEAKWALSSSSKFVFLQSLLKHLRGKKIHIAIAAAQPRLRDILARFLQGIEVNFVRADDPNVHTPEDASSPLRVSIISPSVDVDPQVSQFADAIVVLDGDLNPEAASIKAMRSSPSRAGLSPVIYPIVYCSAEHLKRCIDRMEEFVSEEEKLRALITSINERQAEVGGMADEEYKPEAAGEEVACFLLPGPVHLIWTVLPVRPVKVIGLEHLLSKSQNPEEDGLEESRLIRDDTPQTRKRPYEDDSYNDIEQPKRQRMTPAPEPSLMGDSTVTSQEAQVRDLRQALEKNEKALEERVAKIEALEATIGGRNQALQDYRKAMDDLQARHEKAKRGKQKLHAEHANLMQLAESREKQAEAAKATSEKLRDDVKGLEAELQTAREQLLSSTVPEIVEVEKLRQSNRELVAAKEALERKVDSTTQDFNFTREQYQKASSAAAEAVGQVKELEEEISKLKLKASGEATKLREMTDRSESEAHLAQLSKLRLENEELKEQLRRKERGRGMTTRTGSVAPRSPRLGASPGRSRAGSRAPGSRPGSPVRSMFGARKGRHMVEQAL